MGLREQPKPVPPRETRGAAGSRNAAVKIHSGVDPDFRPATKAHPGLLVSDVARIAQACRAAGFQVREDEPLEGYERVYVNDPFGNRIERFAAE